MACGGETEVAERSLPQKVAALAPSAAETVFALGLEDRVVGVGDYVNWPPQLASKPKLGGLFNPNFERLVALDPDLAILLYSEDPLRERLEAVGVEVLMIPSETLGDVELAIELVGESMGAEEKANEVLRSWRESLAPDPVGGIPSVAVIVGREPSRMAGLVAAGPGTFFDQLLGRLGALNAFRDVVATYPQVGIEEIVARQPDIVLEIQPLEVPLSRVRALEGDWVGLVADSDIAPPCVAVVSGEHVLIPGPRLPLVYRQMRDGILSCLSTPDP